MNLYQEFQALIPKDAVYLATVKAEFPDGTSAVETLDGQLVRVQGAAGRSLDQRVIVTGNRITGEVPTLPTYNIEI
jgi:hypothetical protein